MNLERAERGAESGGAGEQAEGAEGAEGGAVSEAVEGKEHILFSKTLRTVSNSITSWWPCDRASSTAELRPFRVKASSFRAHSTEPEAAAHPSACFGATVEDVSEDVGDAVRTYLVRGKKTY